MALTSCQPPPGTQLSHAALEEQISLMADVRIQTDQGFEAPMMRKWLFGNTHEMTEPSVTRAVKLDLPARDGSKRTIPTLCTVPADCDPAQPIPLVLYFHGGGMVLGSASSEHPMQASVASAASAAVCAPDYRMAPEYVFPAAVDDALDSSLALLALESVGGCSIDRGARGSIGVSAGGYMAAIAARELANVGVQLNVSVSICPMAKPFGGTASEAEFASVVAWPRIANQFAWAAYLRGQPEAAESWRANLLVDPPAKSLDNLPPSYVVTLLFDTLRDEGRAYAERLKALGKLIATKEYPTVHVGVLPGLAAGGAGDGAWDAAVKVLAQHLRP